MTTSRRVSNVMLHPDSALKPVDGLRVVTASQLFPRVAGLWARE